MAKQTNLLLLVGAALAIMLLMGRKNGPTAPANGPGVTPVHQDSLTGPGAPLNFAVGSAVGARSGVATVQTSIQDQVI